jgi:hypothetical protein
MIHSTRDYVSLLSSNDISDLIESQRRVEQCTRQAEMGLETNVILRHNDGKSALWVFNFDKLQNFEVIIVNLIRQREWTHIDNIYIRILHTEKPCYLGIFFLLILFEGHSLMLPDRKRVYVYLNPSTLLDMVPISFKVILHLCPDFELVCS